MEPKPLPDPVEPFRQRLSEIENMSAEERAKPEIFGQRVYCLFFIEKFDEALAEVDAFIAMQVIDSTLDLQKQFL
jgi:hypothetical protein